MRTDAHGHFLSPRLLRMWRGSFKRGSDQNRGVKERKIVLYYCMEVLIRSIAFYFVSSARMEQLEEAGLELCMNLPGIAFYGIYKVIFYCILPYGIMATLPVQSLTGELTPLKAVYGTGLVCAFIGITALVWTKGIRHYNSASS